MLSIPQQTDGRVESLHALLTVHFALMDCTFPASLLRTPHWASRRYNEYTSYVARWLFWDWSFVRVPLTDVLSLWLFFVLQANVERCPEIGHDRLLLIINYLTRSKVISHRGSIAFFLPQPPVSVYGNTIWARPLIGVLSKHVFLLAAGKLT
jgi:hypothetical protein